VREGRQDCRHLSDDELAGLALAGNGEAWSEIARRHTHRVIVTLLARGIALDAAEDLTQDVWLRLMEQQRSGRLTAMRLPGLAIAQAVWLAREAGRTQQRREGIMGQPVPMEVGMADVALVDPAPDPEHRAAHRERLDAIQEELMRCSPRARQVFNAVYGPEARSHADVAKSLGLSVQRVRQILCEVRARMRRVLEEMEGDSTWDT